MMPKGVEHIDDYTAFDENGKPSENSDDAERR